jgi:hypothetical protein
MNKTSLAEHLVFNYLVYGVVKRARNIELITNLILGKELELIRNRVCPYCNAKFGSRHALITHLRKNSKCYELLEGDVKFVVKIYRSLMSRVRGDRNKVLLRLNDVDVMRFRKRDEFREYLRQHPELLNNLNNHKVIR